MPSRRTHKQSPSPRLPPVDAKIVARIRHARALHPRTDNTLRMVSVLGADDPGPCRELCTAVQALGQRHPRADIVWQVVCLGSTPRKRSDRHKPRTLLTPQWFHATSLDAALEFISLGNLYLYPQATYTVADLKYLRYAMALGIPVLGPVAGTGLLRGTARGEEPVVRHGIDGMAVAYADTPALITALARVLFDMDLRMRMSNAGSRRMLP